MANILFVTLLRVNCFDKGSEKVKEKYTIEGSQEFSNVTSFERVVHLSLYADIEYNTFLQ